MSALSGSSRHAGNRTTSSAQPSSWWKPILGIVVVACAVSGAVYWQVFATPLPLCPDCRSTSGLRESLERLAVLWEMPPQSIEDLNAELSLIETADQIQQPTHSNIATRESECMVILLDRFDARVDYYVHDVIAGLVGFGPDDACPKIESLLTLANRLQILMNHQSKEAPKCKELLEWHSLHYSCSAQR